MATTSKGLHTMEVDPNLGGEVYDELSAQFGNLSGANKSNIQKIDELFVAQENAIAGKVGTQEMNVAIANAIANSVTVALNTPT